MHRRVAAICLALVAVSVMASAERNEGGMMYHAQQMYITQNFNGNPGPFLPNGSSRNGSVFGSPFINPNITQRLHKKMDLLINLLREGRNDTTDETERENEYFKSTQKLISHLGKQASLNKEALLKMNEEMFQVISTLVITQAKKSSSAEFDDVIAYFNATLERLAKKLEHIIHHIKQKGCVGNGTDEIEKLPSSTYPKDCEEAYLTTTLFRGSGVYTIQPDGAMGPKEVYCEMGDRKWTVLMRRFNGSVSFDRNWQEYKDGFGSASGEYWIGNEYMHLLTRNRTYDARFDMTEWIGGSSTYSVFSTFALGTEAENYKLRIGGESGTAKRGRMQYHTNVPFTTKDRDHDTNGENCARKYVGPWWHRSCYHVFFTGPYTSRCKTSRDHKCNVWSYHIPLKTMSIKIARKV